MRRDYETWLRRQGYDEGTITAQLHRCGRVEKYLGDLDHHLRIDGLVPILEALRYSTDDERRQRPDPTPIPISGVLRTNLASYRSAVQLYGTFAKGGQREVVGNAPAQEPAADVGLLQIDEAEIVAHEADDPNAVVDLFDAEALAGKDGRDVDPLAIDADAAAGGDQNLAVMQGISELWRFGALFSLARNAGLSMNHPGDPQVLSPCWKTNSSAS